jgi:hypothetical protein
MPTTPDIAFDQLLDQLSRQGFALTPSDYIEFTALFSQFTGTREEFKYHLAPVLCRNREEQTKFYALYDRFTPPDQPKTRPAQDITNPYVTQHTADYFLRRASRQFYFWLFLLSLLAAGIRLTVFLLLPRHEFSIWVPPVNPDSVKIDRDTPVPIVTHHHRVFVVKKIRPTLPAPEERSKLLAQGPPIEKENSVHSTAFAWGLLLGVTCLGLSLSFFPLKRSHSLPHVDIDDINGDDSPLDIPFLPKDHLIQNLPVLARVARDLVQPIPTEVYQLEINKTIRESIRAYGLLTPVYENLERRPEYLLLIDRRQPLQSSLSRYLARTLARYSVPIDYYFYDTPDSSPSASTGAYPASTSPGAFYADGSATPLNPYALRQRHGDAQVIDFSGDNIPEPLLAEFDFGPTGPNAFDIRDTGLSLDDPDLLRQYLNDEDLFQWLCAAAVYPTLRWEVLLAVGAAILKERKALNKLNYISLLKLTRISWLTGAAIPAAIRLELLKHLGLQEELLTRQTILELLKESDDLIVAGTRPFEEKMLQVYTQSFILFAHEPRRNTALEPDARKFMSVWDRRHAPDLATVLYLTNPDRRWDTPIRSIDDPAQTIGANKFINELLALRVIHNPRIRAFFRKAAFSFFFILFLLFLFKDFIQPTALNRAVGLVDRDYPDQKVTVTIPIGGCLHQMLTGHYLLVTLKNYDNNQYSQLIDLDNKKDTVTATFGDITMAGKDTARPALQLILNKSLTIDCPDKEYHSAYKLLLQGDDCEVHLPRVTPDAGRRSSPQVMQQ